jgi:hypothetical protein
MILHLSVPLSSSRERLLLFIVYSRRSLYSSQAQDPESDIGKRKKAAVDEGARLSRSCERSSTEGQEAQGELIQEEFACEACCED